MPDFIYFEATSGDFKKRLLCEKGIILEDKKAGTAWKVKAG